jgi:hypothetical protein
MIEHPWPAFYAGGVESLFAQALRPRRSSLPVGYPAAFTSAARVLEQTESSYSIHLASSSRQYESSSSCTRQSSIHRETGTEVPVSRS